MGDNPLARNWIIVTVLPLVATAWWIYATLHIPHYWLAIVWTVGAIYGCGATALNGIETWQERRALAGSDQRDDRVLVAIANANIRRELLRLLGYVSIIVLGVNVLVGSLIPVLSRSMLILLVAMLIANSLLDRSERERTSRMLSQRGRK